MQEYTAIGFEISVQNIEVSCNRAKAWELSQVRRNHPWTSEKTMGGLGWLEERPDMQVCKAQRVAVPRLEGKPMQFCSPRPSPCGPAEDTSRGQKERLHGWAVRAGMGWYQMLSASPHPAWWEPQEVSVPLPGLGGCSWFGCSGAELSASSTYRALPFSMKSKQPQERNVSIS